MIDLACIEPSPAIDGFVMSKGEAAGVIAGMVSRGAELVVGADANITEAKGHAGKRMASLQLGNTQDVAARYYLLSNNLVTVEKGGNVTIIPTANPDILTLFLKRELDAAWELEPHAARLARLAVG